MTYPPEIAPEIAKRLGKKLLAVHMEFSGTVHNRIERNGVVVQEQRNLYDENDLVAYMLEEYQNLSRYIAEGSHAFCKGKTIEETMYEHALPRHRMHVIVSLGLNKAFADGDFSHLYRFLAFFIRCCYGCAIHAELIRGEGYSKNTGIDHGTYEELVAACFALMRPDWAKRFFPVELGLVKKSHNTTNRIGSLVAALLHDNAAWKEKAYADGKKFLEGKRAIAERALVSYLCALYDADTETMSDNLETLMRNYRKASWLMMVGGECAPVQLFGYYLMGAFYLDKHDFAKVRRPAGTTWWDDYIDLCLQNPLPAALSEPAIIFPEPLDCFNTAVRWIEQGPPPGTVQLSMDIK